LSKIKRKKFTNEFKVKVVRLVIDQDYSIPEACRTFGVSESAMRRWVNEHKCEPKEAVLKNASLTFEPQRIQELEKQIHQLKRENATYKKVASLLLAE